MHYSEGTVTIRVSVEVKEELEKHRESDNESLDSVLRRQLSLPERERKPKALKYPVDLLEVNQSVIIPWKTDEEGNILGPSKQLSISRSVENHAAKTGKEFKVVGLAKGLQVFRKA